MSRMNRRVPFCIMGAAVIALGVAATRCAGASDGSSAGASVSAPSLGVSGRDPKDAGSLDGSDQQRSESARAVVDRAPNPQVVLAPVRQWLTAQGLREGAPLTSAEKDGVLQSIVSSMAAESAPALGADATAHALSHSAAQIQREANLRAAELGIYVVVPSHNPFKLLVSMAQAMKTPDYHFTLVKVIRPTKECVIVVLDRDMGSAVAEARQKIGANFERTRGTNK